MTRNMVKFTMLRQLNSNIIIILAISIIILQFGTLSLNAFILGNDCGDWFDCDNKGENCLPLSNVCDNYEDCANGNDEKGCNASKAEPCGQNYYRCNGTVKAIDCIPESWLCNQIEDCPQNDDEEDCDGRCMDFLCENKRCVNKFKVCNEIDDCGDQSDEIFCHYCKEQGNFMCNQTGHCLSINMRCDGITDCPKGEDEVDCPIALNAGFDLHKAKIFLKAFLPIMILAHLKKFFER